MDVGEARRADFGDGRICQVSGMNVSKRTILILALAGAAAFALLAAALWMILPPAAPVPAETPAEPPIRFGYCGADLAELCILSFGRDARGNSIINFFAPADFPDFYLRIKHFDRESLYVCLRNAENPTSVVCMGGVIHLNERVDVYVMSAEDYRPLAGGTFTVKAILISPQTWELQTLPPAPPASETPAESYPSPSSTLTPTPAVSYPSYP